MLAFAVELAQAAGGIIRQKSLLPSDMDLKADASPVTQADREAEALMRELIQARYPDHGIFGEEEGRYLPDAPLQWVLDPIDGTRAFIAGYATFTTLVALCENGVPQIGVIYQPTLGQCFSAASGKQAMRRDADGERALRVRADRLLAQAVIATTSTDYFTAEEARRFALLRKRGATIVRGGDAYAYAMLAEGRIDAVIDAHMQPYDFCALAPIVEGAGGVITDWQGRELTLGSDGNVLATSSARLHAELLALIKG